MKKLLSIILSITMLLTMSTAAFADETSETTANGTITVGINAEYAPFEYYDEDGELTGFDIDLMNYIGGRIGYGVEFVNMSFDKLIPAVVNGEVDCAISAITVTEERESVVDFTRPYLAANVTYEGEGSFEEYAIVFPQNSKEKAKVIEATGKQSIYTFIDIAIDELEEDGTVEKLIEKYEMNKPLDDAEGYNYVYCAVEIMSDFAEFDSTSNADITVPAPSEWAAKDIDFAYAMGITDNNKQYIYQNNITREEFCELIYNLVTLVKWEITAPVTDSFTDTKNDKILMLNGLGIINGKSATEFAPNDSLTREEAATIIIRMINKIMPMAATEIWFEYDDINEISEWASDSVQTISNLGFMNGVGNNKFAPQETYTTEQAIATLVRVYRSAETAGIIDSNTSIGIIGGADGPTSIIVGDNVNVIEQEDYENFYVEVQTKTTKVDDFYIDEAIKLVTESGELAADKVFISNYTPDEEITEKISALSTVDWGKPTEIYCMAADREQILANLKALYDDELNFDIERLTEWRFEKLWNKLNFSSLASMINASYGSENLAALTILANSRGYVMPKDFADDFALYLQYDGEYSALVSFSEYGEGVISANMSFVKNGDKDNVFRRMYEITSALGENSIEVAKVK